MKLLLSSKYLGKILKKHQEDIEKIQYAEYDKGELILSIGNGFLHINASKVSYWAKNQLINQQKVRWDWLMKSVISLPEQPIILEINDNSAQIILQF